MEKRDLKRARINAIVIGLLLFSTLISFVYAFVQQGIAENNMKMAIEEELNCRKGAEKYEKELRINAAELERATQALAQSNKLLEEQMISAQKKLK